MTLTLELSDLREANEEALDQLGRSTGEQFDEQLVEMENFLLAVYRFAVLAVRRERQMEQAAAIWRETLAVVDRAASRARPLAAGTPGVHASLDRILEIRNAASEMLALYS
jgi:hypothetical protein